MRAELSSADVSVSVVWGMILAGGMGTRLRAAVSDRPKVMALVRGRPFIAHLLDQLASAGIRNVVLCTGYMADRVERELGAKHGPIRLLYSAETTPLGTGGALARAASMCQSDQVLALNGDSYCGADLTRLWQSHMENHARATLQLARVGDTSRYGHVRLELDGRVAVFEEKGSASGPGWINAGIYCLSRSVLGDIPRDKTVSIERDVFPSLIGHGLFGVMSDAPLLDIGTPESYAQADAFLAGLQLHQKSGKS
jgi:D-glycero-alpha-D-manno-heptose 1-phosphate guanylyltransferase